MKEIIARIICCITILLVVAASGCVAPPKGNSTSSAGNFFNPGQTTTTEVTQTPSYVSEVTPFATEHNSERIPHGSSHNLVIPG